MTENSKGYTAKRRRPKRDSGHKACSAKRALLKVRLLNHEVRLKALELAQDRLISTLRELGIGVSDDLKIVQDPDTTLWHRTEEEVPVKTLPQQEEEE